MHKYKTNVTMKDFASDYDELLKSSGGKRLHNNGRQNQKIFNEILGSINRRIIDKIIFENYTFRIPYSIGSISIIKDETPVYKNRLKINWKETNLMWKNNPQAKLDKKMVYFLNEHSNGEFVKFLFLIHHKAPTNMKLYSFVPSDGIKKKLSKAMKNGLVATVAFKRKIKKWKN